MAHGTKKQQATFVDAFEAKSRFRFLAPGRQNQYPNRVCQRGAIFFIFNRFPRGHYLVWWVRVRVRVSIGVRVRGRVSVRVRT